MNTRRNMPPFVVDTREQRPLQLDGAVRGCLASGDYSVSGLEHLVAVERKSIPDLVASLTRERRRFETALARLAQLDHRVLVVEGNLPDVLSGLAHRSRVHPSSLLGSIVSIVLGNGSRAPVPVIFAGDRHTATRFVRRYLVKATQRLETARALARHCFIASIGAL